MTYLGVKLPRYYQSPHITPPATATAANKPLVDLPLAAPTNGKGDEDGGTGAPVPLGAAEPAGAEPAGAPPAGADPAGGGTGTPVALAIGAGPTLPLVVGKGAALEV